MKFFDFDEIKARADCEAVAHELGISVADHRCAATWRGGTNPSSVHLTREGWYDHGEKRGGSALDLVAMVQFSGDIQQAQEWLGLHLGLTPKTQTQPNPVRDTGTRYERLLAEGWVESRRYEYTDARGEPVLYVLRMERTDEDGVRHKEFLQQAADGRWTVKHLPPVLYNLPTVSVSDWAVIVEGEKDADTLRAWGIPVTTNAGGAEKWTSEHSAMLAGKDIVILPDNDAAGRRHAEVVSASLAGRVKSIRTVVLSQLPKGDVTDWVERENGSPERLMSLISRARPLDQGRLNEDYAITRAKEANREPFRNYVAIWEKGKAAPRKDPRHVTEMIHDVHARFLGFPRKVGEELFDHDRDTGRIVFIHSAPQLFAWMAAKSGQRVDWGRGNDYVSKDEFHAAVHASADRYEAVSSTPDWPRRAGTYYSHAHLPEPSPTHDNLERLVSFFNPTTPEFRNLLRCFLCAPIYYEPGIPRPMWIIDSEKPGVGKSTLATTQAELYGHPAVEIKTRDFARDMQEVTKRLVSSEGRQARVVLVDNVTGTFASEELAAMVTMPYLTGRPSYGRGEESRPNDLTYTITANGASVSDDLSIRAFGVSLSAAMHYSETWNRELREFVSARRLHIFADIIDLLSRHTPYSGVSPVTRFPEFEVQVLQPACGDADAYNATVQTLLEYRAQANADEEWGHAIEELIRHELAALHIHPDRQSVWIRSNAAEAWIRDAVPDMRFRNAVQEARNLARAGHLPRVHPSLKVWPHRGSERRRGMLWLNAEADTTPSAVVTWRDGKAERILADGTAEPLPGGEF